MRFDARLAELDFGHWEMQSWDGIPRAEVDAWAADVAHYRPGGGESVAGRDIENKRFGLGFATPREMVILLEELDRGTVVNSAASREMIDLMKREQARYAIGRTLWELPAAGKYGALDHLRSAIGIVYTKKGRIAMAITCDEMPEINWSVDNPGYLLISRLSQMLIDGLAKK